MKYLKELIIGELRRTAKEKEVPKLGGIAGKLEKIGEGKVSQRDANLMVIAQDLEALIKLSPPLQTHKMRDIVKILEEKAKGIELAKKDTLEKIIDDSIAKINVCEVKPGTRKLLGQLMTKGLDAAGTELAGNISTSAARIARYRGKPVDETHILLAIKLIGNRFD